MLDRINNLARINGYHTVRKKAKEELNELIDALEENIEPHIADEMADVFIMLRELMFVYGNENEVYDQIEYKILRQERRFSNDKERD